LEVKIYNTDFYVSIFRMMIKNKSLILFGCILAFSFLLFTSNAICFAAEEVNICVSGKVLDADELFGISGARVLAVYGSTLLAECWTGPGGEYALNFSVRFSKPFELIELYAYYDNSSSPCVDYVPSKYPLIINSENSQRSYTVSFLLNRAATIVCSGIFLHVNFSEPAHAVRFTVVDSNGLRFEHNGSICVYGGTLDPTLKFVFSMFNISSNVIVVPADVEINILVDAYFLIRFYRFYLGKQNVVSIYLFDEPTSFGFGEVFNVSLTEASLKTSLIYVSSLVDPVRRDVARARFENFYVAFLEKEIDKVELILNDASSALNVGDYASCYSLLKEAKLYLMNIFGYLRWARFEAYRSSLLLSIFISLSSIALSYFVTENFKLKVLLSCIFVHFFYFILLMFSPGFISVNPILTYAISMLAFLLYLTYNIFLKYNVFSFRVMENFGEITSLAKRNLRRRRLRSSAMLLSVVLFVAASIAFTSFAIERKISVGEYYCDFKVRGISFERYAFDEVSHGLPVDLSILSVLNLTGEVSYITYRAEDVARLHSIGFILSTVGFKGLIPVMNVISFSSPIDPMAIRLNSCLIAGRLPFGEGEVAISLSASESLDVWVGDNVRFQSPYQILELKVVGILDDERIQNMREISGRPFLPYCLRVKIIEKETGLIIYESKVCKPLSVILISWRDIDKFGIKPTRVFVYMNCSWDELQAYARGIAVQREGYISTAVDMGKACNFILMELVEAKGFETYIAIGLIVLNSIITSMAALHERRRETLTLSAIGASPLNLFKIFVLEAAILGMIGGAIGYVVGLGFYKLLILNPVDVRPKISFMWTILSLLLGFLSIFIGSAVTLRSALIVVPSKIWRIKPDVEPSKDVFEWVYFLPVKLSPNLARRFIESIKVKLEHYPKLQEIRVRVVSLEVLGSEEAKTHRLVFIYDAGAGMSRHVARCFLEVKVEDDRCIALLRVRAYGLKPEKHADDAAKLVRSLILELDLNRL